MKKKTSVEWLIEQFENNLSIRYNGITKQQREQALQMEREQIEEAYETGDKYKTEISGENYYTQTYL